MRRGFYASSVIHVWHGVRPVPSRIWEGEVGPTRPDQVGRWTSTACWRVCRGTVTALLQCAWGLPSAVCGSCVTGSLPAVTDRCHSTMSASTQSGEWTEAAGTAAAVFLSGPESDTRYDYCGQLVWCLK